ncbi:MAG: ABC transporter ATP-binding protein [Planctomycetota bacterium]
MPADDGRPVAQIEAVTKVYRKSKLAPPVHALAGVDLTVPRGQYVAIMGPSGSGKSTMMNIIGCLDRPTAGRYLLDGQDVAQMSDEQLSKVRGRRLGFVFQAFNLIPQLAVVDNVAVPLFYQGVAPAERRRRAAAALDRVGLAERLEHRPAELSGGQQQRVAIARALVNEPRILLADEPTGALDTKTGDAILELFEELHQSGQTVVVITHDEEVAHHCERVVRLRDGLIDRDEAGGKVAAAQPSDIDGSTIASAKP